MVQKDEEKTIELKKSEKVINDRSLGIERIVEIINCLTNKKFGCPWDLMQTNTSLAKHTIEEAYEVAGAIESNSPQETCAELGDLLFNILFHIHLATENDLFTFSDVIEETVQKMVSRHPHVFKDKSIRTVQEVNEQWNEIKLVEKKISKTSRIEQEFNNIIANIPALTHSAKIQKKMASVGFDWSTSYEIINKIYEEIDEFIEEDEKNNNVGKLDELGDILFSVVNLARFTGIDPETALRSTNRKFIKRCVEMERLLNRDGKVIKNVNKKELNLIWEKVKNT